MGSMVDHRKFHHASNLNLKGAVGSRALGLEDLESGFISPLSGGIQIITYL